MTVWHAFNNIYVPDLRAPVKKREMDWQLVATYFSVKSTDTFYSVHKRFLTSEIAHPCHF